MSVPLLTIGGRSPASASRLHNKSSQTVGGWRRGFAIKGSVSALAERGGGRDGVGMSAYQDAVPQCLQGDLVLGPGTLLEVKQPWVE